jgi:ribonuclease HII
MKKAMDKITIISKGAWEPILKSERDLFSKEIDVDQNSWIVSVDGRPMKRIPYRHEGMIKGDTFSLAIAMGSIMAKVTRDRLMRELAKQFKDYDFSSNKGYGSPRHLAGLKERGPCIHHRPRFLRKLLSPEAEKNTTKENSQSQLSFS